MVVLRKNRDLARPHIRAAAHADNAGKGGRVGGAFLPVAIGGDQDDSLFMRLAASAIKVATAGASAML